MSRAICPACAREHSADSRTCDGCGSPLTLKICGHCEAINARDAERCHQCDAALPGGPVSDMSPLPAIASEPPTPQRKLAAPKREPLTLPEDFATSSKASAARMEGMPFATGGSIIDATPVVFAERIEYAQRVFHEPRLPSAPVVSGDAPIPDELPIFEHAAADDIGVAREEPIADRSARPGRARYGDDLHAESHGRRSNPKPRAVHVGSAIMLVTALAGAAYFAPDVPAVRHVVAEAAARFGLPSTETQFASVPAAPGASSGDGLSRPASREANAPQSAAPTSAAATPTASTQVAPRAAGDVGAKGVSPAAAESAPRPAAEPTRTASPDASPAIPAPDAPPPSRAADAASSPPAANAPASTRSFHAPSATRAGAQKARAHRPGKARARTPSTPSRHRRAAPTPTASKDALATRRLIERDLEGIQQQP
jgi:hypothetical protein